MIKQGFIYCGRNILDGMRYIGCHYGTDWMSRPRNHLRGDGNKDIFNEVSEYGIDIIEWECLRNGLTQDELGMWEKHLILQYDTVIPNGYNRTKGGKITKHTPEIRKIISERTKENCRRGENHPTYRKDLWDNKYEIANRYINGEHANQLAIEYNCDSSTICVIVKSCGGVTRSTQYKNSELWERKDEIVKDFLDGKNMSELTEIYGYSVYTMQRILRSEGYKQKPGRPKSKVWSYSREIIDRYDNGESIDSLAKIYDTGTSTIRRILKSRTKI